jgi:predicted PurR-regulated permease PerM/methylmalonyl-CoA mutase cobalamin-binding subunit
VTTGNKARLDADTFRLTMLIFAIIAFMYFTGEVLKPLALSILLSFALAPAARLLEKCGLPRAASVVLTVVVSLGLLAGIGYVVGQQLTSLAKRMPDYQENIENKLSSVINPGQQSAATRLKVLADEVTAKMETAPATEMGEATPIQKVEVIARPSFQDRLRSATGPYLEFLGVGSFVLILVLFMLMGREGLGDRIVGLFGHRQVSLTTRTLQEIAQRISRYLATFALVNSGFGLVIGMGLWLIGAPYAPLWGCLAAMLRFIPYVGPAVAFILPLVFSFAHFPGWTKPLEVVVLFAVVEAALTSFLEPIIYGKTTGISALGLLVAAMFWTWLWGTLGLLLSTPLTVCLAVLGKYVPSLWFFAALLKEEAELDPDVRFYQRLVALDREGAVGVVEGALKQFPRVQVFDKILVPALARAEHDAARGELDESMQAFVWGVVGELLDGLEGTPDFSLAAVALSAGGETDSNARDFVSTPVRIVGLVADDRSDALVLRMLEQLLTAAGCTLEIINDTDSSLQVVERVADQSPDVVIISHLPPEGSTLARYLTRRLRAQFADLPIVVGRWGETDASASAIARLVEVGASRVIFSLDDARAHIFNMAVSQHNAESLLAAAPE